MQKTASLRDDPTEVIAQQALLGWYEAVSRINLPEYDWKIKQIGDAVCSVSATEPSILLNRVVGLGSRAVPTLEQLVEIRQLYRQAGVSRFFLHVLPQLPVPDMEGLLSRGGYKRHRGWMKFTRGCEEIKSASTDLSVRKIGPDEAEDFAAIAGPAFDFSPVSQPVIAAIADDPNWHLYMSFDGLRPAGTGAVYIRGGLAYLDWGATHPDFRCRGSQSAILNERIKSAINMGCTTIVTTTGEAVPDDLQHSYSNILKRGFKETYIRENWIPAES